MMGFHNSPFSSFYGKLYSFQVDMVGGFAGNGALLVTYEAEGAELVLGAAINKPSLWLGEPAE